MRAKTLRLYLPFLALALIFPALSRAEATHLEVARPSREVYPFHGPVKKVTEEYNYEMSDRKYKEIREYDEAGNLKYRKKWDYKDRLTFFATNSFDETGCFVRQRVEDLRNKTTNDYEIVINVPTRQIAYKCEITGEIEICTYNPDRYSMSTTIKRKGRKNLPMSKYKRGPDHTSQSYTRYDDDGRIKYVSSYKRDSEKRLTRAAIDYKREDRKDLNEYEYLAVDEYGNWTQRLLKIQTAEKGEKKKFDKFSTRVIKYYETPEATGDHE